MKRLFILLLPLLIIVILVFTVFGIFQVKFEEEKLMDELQRKAKSVAESIELSARHIFLNRDWRSACKLVESFQNRERLQGCIIYTKDLKIVAITERVVSWKDKEKAYLREVSESKIPHSSLEKFKDFSVYSYVLPVEDDSGKLLGLVEIIYDTSYVFNRLAELWRHVSVTLIMSLLLIGLTLMILHRQFFILPVISLTEWFQRFQKGETDVQHPIRDKGELGKLASEVEQMALSLRIARKTVSNEAKKRLKKEDQWTEEKLRNLILAKIGENAFFVVSNREPYIHTIDEISGKVKWVRPASGVVTALDPVMRSCGGTWIAFGSGNADKKFVNSKNNLGVPPDDIRYILKRVWLSKTEEEGYYYGFSNEGLWPLCHVTHTRPVFREADWRMYKKVNQKFADAVLEELPNNGPMIFIQDYHFTLLPKMIKEKRPDAVIALFWHIPWPNPEVFSICPYQAEILDGMLGCDLIGFHVQFQCNNFMETVNRLIECRVDTEKFSVIVGGKETIIRAFPISVDTKVNRGVSPELAEKISRIKSEYNLAGKIIGLGVERIDYTKGIVERILAIDRFLEKYPEYKQKFVFIQLGAPSRTHIKRYHDLIGEIDELVEKKNWKHSEGDWKPIIYLKRYFSPEDILPFYKMADICMVSSLHDGMNLVAKEFVSAKDDASGMLLLSRFTGAARELTDATLINPYSIEEFADAIKITIELPEEEKKRRMENMRKIVEENNVYRWAGSIVSELTGLKKG